MVGNVSFGFQDISFDLPSFLIISHSRILSFYQRTWLASLLFFLIEVSDNLTQITNLFSILDSDN